MRGKVLFVRLALQLPKVLKNATESCQKLHFFFKSWRFLILGSRGNGRVFLLASGDQKGREGGEVGGGFWQ